MSVSNDWWRNLVTEKDLESILPSNKLRTMFEILRMCEEKGEKCLIFSAFVAVLNVVEYFFKKIDDKDAEIMRDLNLPLNNMGKNRWTTNKDYYRLDGKTPKSIRHEMIKQFNSSTNPRARLFLISAKAGGQGINLIGANRVIILDTSWNPSNDQQNIFRIFRLGQKKNCYVYRLLAMGTMEEKVYSRSVTKQAMSFRVVDEQQIDRHYSMAELAELYTLTVPDSTKRPVPVFPQDSVLANLLRNHPDLVYKYHEHDSLLENKIEQELSEQEKADAWAAYEKDLQQSGEFSTMEEMLASQSRMQKFLPPNMDLNQPNFGQYPAYSPYLSALFERENYQNPMQQIYMNMVDAYRKSQASTNYGLNPPSTSPLNMMPNMLQGPGSSASTNPLAALGDLSMFGGPKMNPSLYNPPHPYNPNMGRSNPTILTPLEIYQQSLKHLSGLYNYNKEYPSSSTSLGKSNMSSMPNLQNLQNMPNMPNAPYAHHDQYLPPMPFTNQIPSHPNVNTDHSFFNTSMTADQQVNNKSVENHSIIPKNSESIPTSVIKKSDQMGNKPINENGQNYGINDKNINSNKKTKAGTISVIPQAQLQSPSAIAASATTMLSTSTPTSHTTTSTAQNILGPPPAPPRMYPPTSTTSATDTLQKSTVYPQKIITSTAAAFERYKNIYNNSNAVATITTATTNAATIISTAATTVSGTTTTSNMGISYGNKLASMPASSDYLKVSNEMQIIPTTSPPGTSSISKQFNEISPSISLTALHDSNAKAAKPIASVQSNKQPNQTFIAANTNNGNKAANISPKILPTRNYTTRKSTTKPKAVAMPTMPVNNTLTSAGASASPSTVSTVSAPSPPLATTAPASATAATAASTARTAAAAALKSLATAPVTHVAQTYKSSTATATATQGKGKPNTLTQTQSQMVTAATTVARRTQSPVGVAVIKRNNQSLPSTYVKKVQNETVYNNGNMPPLIPKKSQPVRSRSVSNIFAPSSSAGSTQSNNYAKTTANYVKNMGLTKSTTSLDKRASPVTAVLGTGQSAKRVLVQSSQPPPLTPSPRIVSAATITAAKTLAAMKSTAAATATATAKQAAAAAAKPSTQIVPTHIYANPIANGRHVSILNSARPTIVNTKGASIIRPTTTPTATTPRTAASLNSATTRTVLPATLSIKNIGQVAPKATNNNAVQKMSAAGQYIIEGSVNDRRIAIGAPTKSGGGTTITKLTAQNKRKQEVNVLPKDFEIKRTKMSINKINV